MAKPLVSQVFGKIKDYRMSLGKHETKGGHEICLGLRVCLYEEYVAATHHLRKDMGRITGYHTYGRKTDREEKKLVGGTVTRILPGNFSCEVEWDNGQKGTYFQSALYTGEDVPQREQGNYEKLLESRKLLDQRPDLKKKRLEKAQKEHGGRSRDVHGDGNAAASRNRWAHWRPN